MKTIILFGSALSSLLTQQAFAQEDSGWYATAGYSHIEYDGSDFTSHDDGVGALTLRGGYDFNQYLSLEVEGSTGITKAENATTGIPNFTLGGPSPITGVGRIDSEVELSHSFGAFAKVQYPVSDRFAVFGRAGFVSQKYDATSTASVVAPGGATGSSTFSNSIEDDSVALGAGFEFDLTEQHGLRAGYTRNLGDLNQDTLEIAYVFRFGK